MVRPAAAQELVLRPQYLPGDVYRLALTKQTVTDAASRSHDGRSFEEDVELAYSARVEVLEVDSDGQPVRERHERVRLTFERPDGSGSLFRKGTRYEVRRGEGGSVALFVRGARVDREIERVVAPILEGQFEHGPGPALVDPGRPVGVGDRWELSEGRARDLLRREGWRAISFGGAPTATLERHPTEPRVARLVYRIPLDWVEPVRSAPNAETSKSGGIFQGTVDLPPDPHGRPLAHASSLETDVSGLIQRHGVTRNVPWRLSQSKRFGQSVESIARSPRPDGAWAATGHPASPPPESR